MENENFICRPVISTQMVIQDAVEKCLDMMYRLSYPSITLQELKDKGKGMTEEEHMNSPLFEQHYLPQKIHEAIMEDFINAYQLDSDLPVTAACLKGYFKQPISEKYIEVDEDSTLECMYETPMPDDVYEVVEKYMDMAEKFFKWDGDKNAFTFNVCNVSPSGNREAVEKWYHEHGQPDFKIPDDSWWVDEWEDEE